VRIRVVVTGVGPVTPIGIGREAFWTAACRGDSGTEALATLPLGVAVETFRSRVAAPVHWNPALADGATRQQGLAGLALRLALADAGVPSLAQACAAVVVGTAVAGTREMEADYLSLRKGPPPAGDSLMSRLSFHAMAEAVATACSCDGPVLTVATGCTSGLDAIGVAFDLIRSGEVEMAVAGAVEAPLTPVVFAAFDVIGALTRQNHRPSRASRPFDAERDGFVLGEGGALLVLESLERARARRAHVYAEIEGSASLGNGYHMTDLPPEGEALAECMEEAMADAALSPGDIDQIDAHGSSTPQNDVCETSAIKAALGAQGRRVAVTALKGMVGHALGASNAIEVAACALMLDRQYLLPTINLDTAGPGCDLDYVANTGRPARLRHTLKLSNGFSGIHSVLALAAGPQGSARPA
jgi:3-oxoacyl-(acyl-carrier-protein) synthase